VKGDRTKVSAFAQVGYRTFPEDFEQHLDSSVDTPWRLADPREVRAAMSLPLDVRERALGVWAAASRCA
jgi:hypothetical protein